MKQQQTWNTSRVGQRRLHVLWNRKLWVQPEVYYLLWDQDINLYAKVTM